LVLALKSLSLSKKLLVLVFVTSTIGTTLSSAVQILVEYGVAKNEQNNEIKAFETTALPSLEDMVWNFNDTALAAQLRSMINTPDFISIRVFNEKQKLIDEEVKDNDFERVSMAQFELRNPSNTMEVIGRVELKYTTDLIVQDIERKTFVIIGSNLIKTFIVSLILLILFRMHFVDRLTRLTQSLREEKWSQPKEIVHSQIVWPFDGRSDEITEIEASLNTAIGIIRSNREQLEKAAVASARMAELGIFAAGIAHEINNPLAIILGNGEKIERHLKGQGRSSDNPEKSVEVIRKSVHRIGQIISGLKSLARDGAEDEKQPFELPKLIEDVRFTYESSLPMKNIKFEINDQTKPLQLFGRSVQICQVLLNLINNATDAISKLDEKWIRLEFATEQHTLVCRVTDSGSGIPESLQDKLFVPFFTTKEVGKGTGLGLSIASSIIQQHGGTLDINPQSANTQFVIRLPIYKEYEDVS
jgi:C4-dicarboxylate-specific signal transduction histidine kinase